MGVNNRGEGKHSYCLSTALVVTSQSFRVVSRGTTLPTRRTCHGRLPLTSLGVARARNVFALSLTLSVLVLFSNHAVYVAFYI